MPVYLYAWRNSDAQKKKIPFFTLIYTIVGYVSFFKCQVKFIFK